MKLHSLENIRPTATEALTGMLAPSRAFDAVSFLEEFRDRYERVVCAHETHLTADLRSRGPSDDLLHEWSLVIAQMQDFMAAVKVEIENAERDQ